MVDRLITVREAADILGVTRPRVDQLMAPWTSSPIREVQRVGNKRFVRKADVLAHKLQREREGK